MKWRILADSSVCAIRRIAFAMACADSPLQKLPVNTNCPDQAPAISVDYLPLAAKACSVGHDRAPSDFSASSVHF
jgi:hypothetical protein